MSKKSERAHKLANMYNVLARLPVNENGECTLELDEVTAMMALIAEVLALDGIHPL
jgi:hypothetical protein